jgi:hypothetical protein
MTTTKMSTNTRVHERTTSICTQLLQVFGVRSHVEKEGYPTDRFIPLTIILPLLLLFIRNYPQHFLDWNSTPPKT